jgi:Right handed beta helix region
MTASMLPRIAAAALAIATTGGCGTITQPEQDAAALHATELQSSAAPAPARVPTRSPFDAWTPPEGIPSPSFGIRESAPAPPEPWTNPTVGFFYVDATAQGATDEGNPYGTPSRPRVTIPRELPAGSVVELRGTYDHSHTSPNTLLAAGTAEAPVFIRGANAAQRPRVRRQWEVKGTYVILEHLEFTRLNEKETGSLVMLAPLRWAAVRGSELSGNTSGGGLGIVSWNPPDAVENVVIIGNRVHDNGDVKASFDQDVHGISVGSHVSHLWVVDNELARNSGDGIQINAGNRANQPTTHHIYVARNIAHHNKQTGFWTKQAVDVVFSQNLCYDHRLGNSSIGACMGMQYAPERVWFVSNHIHGSDYGIAFASDSDMGSGKDSFILGNVIHDIHRSGEFDPNTAWASSGVMLAGGVNRYIVNNTIHDVDGGINSPAPGNNYIVNNSVTALAAGRGYHLFLELPSAVERSVVHHNLFDREARIRWGSDQVLDWSGLQSLLPARGIAPVEGPMRYRNPARDDFRPAAEAPMGSVEAAKIGEAYGKVFGVELPGDFRMIGSFSEFAKHPPSAPLPSAR